MTAVAWTIPPPSQFSYVNTADCIDLSELKDAKGTDQFSLACFWEMST